MENMIINLVKGATQGSKESMGRLFSMTLRDSYFLADILSCDSEEAVEIVKKAYARVFCTISKLKKPEAFEIWMKQNVSSVYKEGRTFTFDDADAEPYRNSMEFLPESIFEDAGKMLRVSAAVKNLKEEKRAVIVLKYNNGMPEQAIAKFMGVSVSTVVSLLNSAKSEIVSACEFEGEQIDVSDELPVLTRLFKKISQDTVLTGDTVREIFSYSMEIYSSFKAADENAEGESGGSDDAGEELEENAGEAFDIPRPVSSSKASAPEAAAPGENVNKEAAPSVPSAPSAPSVPSVPSLPEMKEKAGAFIDEQAKNVLSFKDKIALLLSDGPDAVAQKEQIAKDEDGISIPKANTAENKKEEKENLDLYEGDEDDAPAKKESKFDIKAVIENIAKKLNPRLLIVCAVALIVLILIIVGISKGVSKHKEEKENTVVTTAADAAFYPGGFEEVSEITYLNSRCFSFKYVVNGKYGLMDYRGNILLNPDYDGFSICSYGRDYSSRDSYHILCKIGGEDYEVSIQSGQAVIDSAPHQAHSMQTETLPADVSYDERDCYYEGYAAARKKGKWGYVSQDKDKKVIPFEYDAVNDVDGGDVEFSDYCRPVNNGLIPVKKDGYMGIINLDNEVIVNFEYQNILCGDDGVFIAKKNDTWGVILVGDAVNTFSGINLAFSVSPVDLSSTEEPVKYKVDNQGSVNVRSTASAETNDNIIGEISSGSEIEVYKTETAANGKNWALIKYGTGYGYVSMSRISKVS